MLKSYLIPRISQWGITIFIGITVTFIIPRMIPGDPVERTLSSLGSLQTLDPRAVENLKEVLADLYGLGGTQLDQYINFWKRLVRGDLGPSLSSFPTPVTEIIAKGLPWTVGLLTTSTLISWLLGVILGTLAGYSPSSVKCQVSSVKCQIIDKVFISIYPIPHYILALILVMIFSYYFPIFPLVGGSSGKPALSWAYISSIFEHSLLPATSLIFLSTAF